MHDVSHTNSTFRNVIQKPSTLFRLAYSLSRANYSEPDVCALCIIFHVPIIPSQTCVRYVKSFPRQLFRGPDSQTGYFSIQLEVHLWLYFQTPLDFPAFGI